jgi:hypothetical protein
MIVDVGELVVLYPVIVFDLFAGRLVVDQIPFRALHVAIK